MVFLAGTEPDKAWNVRKAGKLKGARMIPVEAQAYASENGFASGVSKTNLGSRTTLNTGRKSCPSTNP